MDGWEDDKWEGRQQLPGYIRIRLTLFYFFIFVNKSHEEACGWDAFHQKKKNNLKGRIIQNVKPTINVSFVNTSCLWSIKLHVLQKSKIKKHRKESYCCFRWRCVPDNKKVPVWITYFIKDTLTKDSRLCHKLPLFMCWGLPSSEK